MLVYLIRAVLQAPDTFNTIMVFTFAFLYNTVTQNPSFLRLLRECLASLLDL